MANPQTILIQQSTFCCQKVEYSQFLILNSFFQPPGLSHK